MRQQLSVCSEVLGRCCRALSKKLFNNDSSLDHYTSCIMDSPHALSIMPIDRI